MTAKKPATAKKPKATPATVTVEWKHAATHTTFVDILSQRGKAIEAFGKALQDPEITLRTLSDLALKAGFSIRIGMSP